MDVAPLFLIAGAICIGAMSPGPSFVYISRLALSQSRAHGIAAAFGMGAASVVFALVAVLGLSAVFAIAEGALVALKIVGGCYLVYLGVRLWRGAGKAHSTNAAPLVKRSIPRSFGAGALAQLSNPKTSVVYGSIFATLLPPQPESWLFWAIPPVVFLIETAWYVVVASVFSAAAPRRVYERFAKVVDRVAGVSLASIGAVFATDGVRTATS